MSAGPEWFAPRRYGYGAGVPISWQGWLVTAVFLGGIFGAILLFHDRPPQMIAVWIPFTLMFLVISSRTTRGGWRWRWGEEE